MTYLNFKKILHIFLWKMADKYFWSWFQSDASKMTWEIIFLILQKWGVDIKEKQLEECLSQKILVVLRFLLRNRITLLFKSNIKGRAKRKILEPPEANKISESAKEKNKCVKEKDKKRKAKIFKQLFHEAKKKKKKEGKKPIIQ